MSDSLLARIFRPIEKNEKRIVAAAIAFQLLFLCAMMLSAAMPHIRGETLLVRVVPVDPRDMFRGDYVILSYEFSRTPLNQIEDLKEHEPNKPVWKGKTVYVSLKPSADGKHWEAGAVSTKPPEEGKYLRGVIKGNRRLEFGIEQFFVQEGKGKEYEKAIRSRKLSAEISVTPEGKAAVRRLVYD